MTLTQKEKGTLIFALEEYIQALEKAQDYTLRNAVYEVLWKVAN